MGLPGAPKPHQTKHRMRANTKLRRLVNNKSETILHYYLEIWRRSIKYSLARKLYFDKTKWRWRKLWPQHLRKLQPITWFYHVEIRAAAQRLPRIRCWPLRFYQECWITKSWHWFYRNRMWSSHEWAYSMIHIQIVRYYCSGICGWLHYPQSRQDIDWVIHCLIEAWPGRIWFHQWRYNGQIFRRQYWASQR